MIYKRERKKEKELNELKEEIILFLPELISQILLLTNSGTVLTDALKKVIISYRNMPENNRNHFVQSLIDLLDETDNNGENIVYALYRYARLSGVRELIRIASFLYENLDKGTDIYFRLYELGERLWEERKQLCMEKIRKAGTKMSFPLGIMLISLIIMTAAPALINM